MLPHPLQDGGSTDNSLIASGLYRGGGDDYTWQHEKERVAAARAHRTRHQGRIAGDGEHGNTERRSGNLQLCALHPVPFRSRCGRRCRRYTMILLSGANLFVQWHRSRARDNQAAGAATPGADMRRFRPSSDRHL